MPKPPDFHGTTFVKQLLLELSLDRAALQQAENPQAFALATQPLWAHLDQLHTHLWRNGKPFPVNARARAGAQVVANFLLSAEAQARKADISVWGDGTVLDIGKIPAPLQATMRTTAPGALTERVPTLAEPHASWVEALEAEWLKRYGSR
ncbi:hypothetical protein [Rhodoferax sp.]|uniref:hypothetical protein n=1 Tax=Rhodoferax sp. TaxID=50421 RepID=UPI0025D4FD6B|nr:hypothetical protein [Rhodoferax sp.]